MEQNKYDFVTRIKGFQNFICYPGMMLSIRQLETEKKAILTKIAIYLNKCFCFSDMELWDIEVFVHEVRDHLKSLDTAASME